MSILIGADLVPTKSNVRYFEEGNAEYLLGADLLEVMKQADYRIMNLETPLCDEESPILKCGPNLIASAKSVNGYAAMGIDFVTMANNHILDHGEQALNSTCKVLDEKGIVHLGTGDTMENAWYPCFFTWKNKKIGIYACAENEFTIATEETAGANPFDPLNSPDHVQQAKKQCDYLIVLYHGGREYYRYPSVELQKRCRKLVEKGADLVLCQHSHCVGCEEKYQDSTIVYGQGNFLFDDGDDEFWATGLLIQIDEDFAVTYLPLKKVDETVRLAQGEEAEEILSGFQLRSSQILNPEFVKTNYRKTAEENLHYYLLEMSGLKRNILYRAMNKLLKRKLDQWYLAYHMGMKKLLQLENYISCEAHREIILTGIQKQRRSK